MSRLKESLLKEVQDNSKQNEEKLDKVVKENRSYAETGKNGEEHCSPTVNRDFRSILKDARNEELAEESDKELRSFNLIVHGVNEANREDKDEAKRNDEVFATPLLETFRPQQHSNPLRH